MAVNVYEYECVTMRERAYLFCLCSGPEGDDSTQTGILNLTVLDLPKLLIKTQKSHTFTL